MAGNIDYKEEYTYTAGNTSYGTLIQRYEYTYDTVWKDKLVNYNRKAITYDASGNPLSYNGWTFTWQGGRQLASLSKTGATVSYKYNQNGIRTVKTVNGKTIVYTLIDNRITHQTDGTNNLYYRYNSNDELIGFSLNDTDYIYIKNLQGDIIAIADASGNIVVEYTYDAWGAPLSITGSAAATVGAINPFRFKGYYYGY